MRAGLAAWLGCAALGLAVAAWGCGAEFIPASTGSGGSGAAGTGGQGGDGAGAQGGGGMGGQGGQMCMTTDEDGDGQTPCDGDCDDNDPTSYEGAGEICGDGADNDCDGDIDPDSPCQGLGTFVAESGNDNDPGTKSAPVRTILQGITNAQTIGDGHDVYVAEGQYQEDVVLFEGISVLGGYEDQAWTRDPAVYMSNIVCQGFACIQANSTITRATTFDGFTISGKDGTPPGAPGGVAVQLSGGTPVVSNNRIVAGGVSGSARSSVGVYINGIQDDPLGPLLRGNEIAGGQSAADAGIGILIDGMAVAEIVDNLVIRGGTGVDSFGIAGWGPAAGTRIANNTIQAGTATSGNAFGIATHGELEIAGNRINANLANAPVCQSNSVWCGGIATYSAKATITNNIVFGAASDQSAAVYIAEAEGAAQALYLNSNYLDGLGKSPPGPRSAAILLGSPHQGPSGDAFVGFIRNNILVGGRNTARYGVYEDTVLNQTCSPVAFTNNLFFFAPQSGASDTLYREWDGFNPSAIVNVANLPAPYVANITGDPMIDMTFHLTSGSPCIDAGTAEEAPAIDFEGHARPMGAAHDIGPDESM